MNAQTTFTEHLRVVTCSLSALGCPNPIKAAPHPQQGLKPNIFRATYSESLMEPPLDPQENRCAVSPLIV